jgi:4-hydroxy-2-oxoheptanedioate aldolase
MNPLKRLLYSKQVSYGIWNSIPNTYIGEILSGSGYDWICIDNEHGPFDLNSTIHQLQAINSHDTLPIVRLPDDHPTTIKKYLDIGAMNLMIPMVETKEQVIRVIQAISYPPKGIRGVAPGLSRAAQWGRKSDYLETADDQIVLMVQVESKLGLNNLDDILSVDRLDGVFIGPSDLSSSLGKKGDVKNQEVKDRIHDALKQIRKRNKTAGILALDHEDIVDYCDSGANFVGIAVDALILANHASKFLNQVKGNR